MITFNMNEEAAGALPISFATASASHTQENVRRPGGLSEDQILIVTSGRGTLTYGGQSYPLARGVGFYIAKGHPMHYTDAGGLTTAFLTFCGESAEALSEYFGKDFLYRDQLPVERYVSAIERILDIYYYSHEMARMSSEIYAFYVDFLESPRKREGAAEVVAAYIQQNFAKEHSLDSLAAVAHCSVSKLCHDFKAEYGRSVIDYLLDVRLRYAKNLLSAEPDLRVKQVAMSSGFDDVGYFCRIYKKRFGNTPSAERGVI